MIGDDHGVIPLRGLRRHLVPTDFTHLVRDGWLGDHGVPLDTVIEKIRESVCTVGAELLLMDYANCSRENGDGLGECRPIAWPASSD